MYPGNGRADGVGWRNWRWAGSADPAADAWPYGGRTRLPAMTAPVTGITVGAGIALKEMTPTHRRTPRLSRWLMKSAAMLAAVAQLAIAMLPVIEGRLGIGIGPHVESSAAGGHYAHDEARCPSCQAQAIHGVLQALPPLGEYGVEYAAIQIAPATPVESAPRVPSNSRAPPV